MMYEVNAYKDRFYIKFKLHTAIWHYTLRNKGYNVRLGTRRQVNEYLKYVTINTICRSITIFL